MTPSIEKALEWVPCGNHVEPEPDDCYYCAIDVLSEAVRSQEKEIVELKQELEEQCMVNGMGMEREAKLISERYYALEHIKRCLPVMAADHFVIAKLATPVHIMSMSDLKPFILRVPNVVTLDSIHAPVLTAEQLSVVLLDTEKEIDAAGVRIKYLVANDSVEIHGKTHRITFPKRSIRNIELKDIMKIRHLARRLELTSVEEVLKAMDNR